MDPKISFQGERGAYSEEAIVQKFGEDVELHPRPFLREVFSLAEVGMVDYAVVPLENSLEGSVGGTYDLLYSSNLKIVGEIVLRVRHHVMVNEGVSLEDIREVWSHPQALSQCRGYIERQGWKPVPMYDTAGSAKMLKEQGRKDVAAIASRRAAEFYGLKVLAEEVEDVPLNFTRFLILGREEAEPTGKDKTSIIFAVSHRPGALYNALRVFAERKINLTKIESRPTKLRPWEYYFFVDFEGHRREKAVAEALAELAGNVLFIKVLGSYPRSQA